LARNQPTFIKEAMLTQVLSINIPAGTHSIKVPDNLNKKANALGNTNG
jgi:hypothetical protein